MLRARVAEQADVTIAELRTWVAREHGASVSHPVMWHTLARLGLTLKKAAPRGRTGPRCSPSSMQAEDLDAQALPAEIARREALTAKLDAAPGIARQKRRQPLHLPLA